MLLDYTDLHWGTPPTGDESMQWLAAGTARRHGRIRSIAYVTRKDESVVYDHEFGDVQRGVTPPDAEGSVYPYLLRPGAGAARITSARGPLVALGRVIELRMADGRVLHTPFLWVATTGEAPPEGHPVILASRFGPTIAIEHRVVDGQRYPFITRHGIEG